MHEFDVKLYKELLELAVIDCNLEIALELNYLY